MKEMYTAEALATREKEFDYLAIEYGFQRNMLVCLRNLFHYKPPITKFDIGLPPMMHESRLFLIDCPDEDLEEIVQIADNLGINFISGKEIEQHVFDRMYRPENCLKILIKTLDYFINSGFNVCLEIAFGAHLERLKRHYENPTNDAIDEDMTPLIPEEIVHQLSNIDIETKELEGMLWRVQQYGLTGHYREMRNDAVTERFGGDFLFASNYIPNLQCKFIIPTLG